MYSDAVLDHFRNPRCAGVLTGASATGRATNPGCGDEVELSVRLEGGAVAEARFRARGCVALIACASRLAERVRGLPAAQAAALDPTALEADLGGLPPTSRHASRLVLEALRAALAVAAGVSRPNTVPS